MENLHRIASKCVTAYDLTILFLGGSILEADFTVLVVLDFKLRRGENFISFTHFAEVHVADSKLVFVHHGVVLD